MEHPIPAFEGEVYTPQDQQYEEARKPWRRSYNSLPAIIVEPASMEDVQKAVRHASDHGMPIDIQATGHGAIQPTDGALLIKTNRLKNLTIDAQAETATFEPGVMIGDVVNAASRHSLTPITGDSPYVGATGFTLGGGHGWLSRQYGLAADSIINATIITASGDKITVNQSDNPDLFQGLKGGSGNFGIVVSLTVKLYKVEAGLGGAVYFDAAHARTLLERYSNWALQLPNNYTAILQAITMPPIPQISEAIRGRRTVSLQIFFNDMTDQAPAMLQEFLQSLEGVSPLLNDVRKLTYAEFMSAAPNIPPTNALDAISLQPSISTEQLPKLARFMQETPGVHPIFQIRPWGGALAAPQPDSPLKYADVGYSIFASQSLKGDAEAIKADFAPLAEHIQNYALKKTFINFSTDPSAIHNAFDSDIQQKMLALKEKYDPENLFRFGHSLK